MVFVHENKCDLCGDSFPKDKPVLVIEKRYVICFKCLHDDAYRHQTVAQLTTIIKRREEVKQ